MKIALGILALLVIGFLGRSAWTARAEAAEVRAEVERLEDLRHQAEADADAWRAEADSLEAIADSLFVEVGTVRTETEAVVREIETEADSLGNALKNALDSLGAPNSLKAVVDDLTGQVSRVRAEYTDLLTLNDSMVGVLRSQVRVEQEQSSSLRMALAAKDQQAAILRAAWEAELNPGIFRMFTRDIKAKATVSAVAFALGYLAGK